MLKLTHKYAVRDISPNLHTIRLQIVQHVLRAEKVVFLKTFFGPEKVTFLQVLVEKIRVLREV